VDGNVARVLARLFLVEGAPEEQSTRRLLWALAGELVPADRPGDFNQALMDLGATVCGGRAPACPRCPLARLCAARRTARECTTPPARQRPARAQLEVACAVIERGRALLLARRPADGLFGGLWELPSAVVAHGGDPRAALRRELRKRLALRVAPGEELAAVERALTHRRLRLVAYRCRARAPSRGEHLRLVSRAAVDRLPLAAAMRALLDALDPALAAPGPSPARSRPVTRARKCHPRRSAVSPPRGSVRR
jgi:A/G-specific adenine glycosylase